jgi:hypothetical protein
VIFHLERFFFSVIFQFLMESILETLHFHLVKLYLFKLSTAFTVSVDGTYYVLYLFKLWETFLCVCVSLEKIVLWVFEGI